MFCVPVPNAISAMVTARLSSFGIHRQKIKGPKGPKDPKDPKDLKDSKDPNCRSFKIKHHTKYDHYHQQ